MGKIYISGLCVPTLIGVYDWERERLTELIIDVEIDANLERAMHTDDVADTIDYAKVAECIVEVGKTSRFELLEALGGAIMRAVLQQFPVHAIAVKIVKPNILPNANTVAVALSQVRG
jgi:dihydroneopterin aldolase